MALTALLQRVMSSIGLLGPYRASPLYKSMLIFVIYKL
jgi:hypothetical protein